MWAEPLASLHPHHHFRRKKSTAGHRQIKARQTAKAHVTSKHYMKWQTLLKRSTVPFARNPVMLITARCFNYVNVVIANVST